MMGMSRKRVARTKTRLYTVFSMPFTTPIRSQPLDLTHDTESQVYGLFALAVGITLVGVYLGMHFVSVLFSSGVLLLFLILELALLFTSRLWMDRSPLNAVLFGLFPLLSGLTLTPYIMAVLVGYANGGTILINALASTVFMAAAAAVFAKSTRWDLGVLGKTLFLGILGLIFLGLLQVFFPSLQGGTVELFVSGAGVVLFALFTAYDVQRVAMQSRYGANAFMLALSLYLDVFNLFLYILRFMLAVSGNRRR